MRSFSRLCVLLLAAFMGLGPSWARAEITFAVASPLSGQDAAFGEQVRQGAEAAIAFLNEKGGVLGQKIKLLTRDDVCDPRQAVAVANELVGGRTVVVIGHACSGAAIPASKVYNEEGVLMITPSATNPILTSQGFDTVFRVCGRDDQQGAIVGDFMAKRWPKGPLAVVHDRSGYGQGIAEEVKKTLKRHGITPKIDESIARGERDYGALVSRLKQEKIAALFYGGYYGEAGLILRQMRAQKLDTVLVGGDGLLSTDFWSIAGNAAEGALMSFNPDPRERPEAVEAVKRLRAKGYEPDGYTLYSWAAVEIAAEALRRANSTALEKVKAALRGGSFATVIGPIAFDAQGDVTRPDYILYRWTKGTYVPLEKAGRANGKD